MTIKYIMNKEDMTPLSLQRVKREKERIIMENIYFIIIRTL
jgi:hypothetical protein